MHSATICLMSEQINCSGYIHISFLFFSFVSVTLFLSYITYDICYVLDNLIVEVIAKGTARL